LIFEDFGKKSEEREEYETKISQTTREKEEKNIAKRTNFF